MHLKYLLPQHQSNKLQTFKRNPLLYQKGCSYFLRKARQLYRYMKAAHIVVLRHWHTARTRTTPLRRTARRLRRRKEAGARSRALFNLRHRDGSVTLAFCRLDGIQTRFDEPIVFYESYPSWIRRWGSVYGAPPPLLPTTTLLRAHSPRRCLLSDSLL